VGVAAADDSDLRIDADPYWRSGGAGYRTSLRGRIAVAISSISATGVNGVILARHNQSWTFNSIQFAQQIEPPQLGFKEHQPQGCQSV
jgi:hypothetical protein